MSNIEATKQEIRDIASSLGLRVAASFKIFDGENVVAHPKNISGLLDEMHYRRHMANLSSVTIIDPQKIQTQRKDTLTSRIIPEKKNFSLSETELKKWEDVGYEFKQYPPPYEVQKYCVVKTWDLEVFALLLEMGIGKTKITLDTAGCLYEYGLIDSMIVIAPNGIHQQWIAEVEEHLPERIKRKTAFWRSIARKAETLALNDLKKEFKGLKIFTINLEAFTSNKAKDYTLDFLENNTCLLVVDESSRIKDQTAKRTKFILQLSKKAKFKRILTGTPVTQGPMDLYPQFNFLDQSILGFNSFVAFRARYAEIINHKLKWELLEILKDRELADDLYEEQKQNILPASRLRSLLGSEHEHKFKRINTCLHKNRFYIDNTKPYKYLEELSDKIQPFSIRILKDDCLDLPKKIFTTREVELSEEQQRLYKELRDDSITRIEGRELSAALVIVRMLRLQEIIGGHYRLDDDLRSLAHRIEGPIPKMQALLEDMELISSDSKMIVWARWTAEVERIYDEVVTKFGLGTAVKFYGKTKEDARNMAIKKFQDPESGVQWFIGNQAAGGIGRNLTAANYMAYYSNSFSLETRLQSEDRAHRIGQYRNVNYRDYLARGTLDKKIIHALQNKKEVADEINREGVSFLGGY